MIAIMAGVSFASPTHTLRRIGNETVIGALTNVKWSCITWFYYGNVWVDKSEISTTNGEYPPRFAQSLASPLPSNGETAKLNNNRAVTPWCSLELSFKRLDNGEPYSKFIERVFSDTWCINECQTNRFHKKISDFNVSYIFSNNTAPFFRLQLVNGSLYNYTHLDTIVGNQGSNTTICEFCYKTSLFALIDNYDICWRHFLSCANKAHQIVKRKYYQSLKGYAEYHLQTM